MNLAERKSKHNFFRYHPETKRELRMRPRMHRSHFNISRPGPIGVAGDKDNNKFKKGVWKWEKYLHFAIVGALGPFMVGKYNCDR